MRQTSTILQNSYTWPCPAVVKIVSQNFWFHAAILISTETEWCAVSATSLPSKKNVITIWHHLLELSAKFVKLPYPTVVKIPLKKFWSLQKSNQLLLLTHHPSKKFIKFHPQLLTEKQTHKGKNIGNPQNGSPISCSPPNGGPKLTARRYHYKGSCYVTVGLLGLGSLSLILTLTLIVVM